jgi:hypothetical protein
MPKHARNHNSTRATITAEDHGGIRFIAIDCPHATTTIVLNAALSQSVDELIGVRIGLIKHFAEERCSCTQHLRRRYGLVA